MSLMTHAADGDGKSQVQTAATGLPCRCQRKEPTAHVQTQMHHWARAHRCRWLSLWPAVSASPLLAHCLRVCVSFHPGTLLFLEGTAFLRAPWEEAARQQGPRRSCRVKAGSRLPRQPQQRRPRKDAEGPGFLGAPSKTQPFSREAGIGAGQTWVECPSPWVGGHRGPSEISNPMSIIKREPGASQGRQGTVSGTRVMGKNAGHSLLQKQKTSGRGPVILERTVPGERQAERQQTAARGCVASGLSTSLAWGFLEGSLKGRRLAHSTISLLQAAWPLSTRGYPGDGDSVAKRREKAGSLRPLWAGHANCRRLAPRLVPLRCERILPPWVCPCYQQPSAIPEVPTWTTVPRAWVPTWTARDSRPALPSSCFSHQTP